LISYCDIVSRCRLSQLLEPLRSGFGGEPHPTGWTPPEVRKRTEHLGDFAVHPRVLRITALAVPVGAIGAGMAWCLLRLIGLITNLVFYQRVRTSLAAPGLGHHSWLVILLAPIGGGLIVGVMARFGTDRIRGHGMPEAIEAILVGGSRVQPRVALFKPISAAISIGTGGPFGAEGPIIMTGGAAGSILAQFLHLSADERKTLLVAGAAAGMAAVFNSPLASVLLAVELLLFEFRPRSFVPVVCSVAISTVIRGWLLGTGAIFLVAPVHVHLTAIDELLCLVPGITGGLLAVAATALVYASEDAFGKLPIHWMWWPAIGGLIIGVGGLIEPRALGVGYDVIRALLTGHAALSLIIGILIVKTIIWGLSIGSGTSAGVLAPTFMIGAALGALEAHALPVVVPGFWAAAGLAAVLGGVMRSPLTGVVFPLELTHAWPLVLPLLVASTTAYAVSVLILKRSVLTEKIARRGLHLSREYTVDPLEVILVREVMRPLATGTRAGAQSDGDAPRRVGADATLRDVVNHFAATGSTRALVVEQVESDQPLGEIELDDLLEARERNIRAERHRERLLDARWPRLPLGTPRYAGDGSAATSAGEPPLVAGDGPAAPVVERDSASTMERS
jgi:H+/Cl- antiporter ClcA